MAAAGLPCDGDGNGDTVRHETYHIVKSDHLEQRFHKASLRAELADRHDRGCRSRCRRECRQNHGEREIDPQHHIGYDEYKKRGE